MAERRDGLTGKDVKSEQGTGNREQGTAIRIVGILVVGIERAQMQDFMASFPRPIANMSIHRGPICPVVD